MTRDKYGYEIPTKVPLEIKQGSEEGLEHFRKVLLELKEIVNRNFPDERDQRNRVNALLSAMSNVIADMSKEAIQRHERGENPNYGRILSICQTTRKKLKELEVIFQIQEVSITEYLSKSPMLIKEEVESLAKQHKEQGDDFTAEKITQEFSKLFEQTKKEYQRNKKEWKSMK